MSKVICDICGTLYPDTAESCPICGYAQFPDVELTEEDLLMEEPPLTRNKGGKYAESGTKRKSKEIFDYDRANGRPEPEEEDEEDDEYDEYEQEDEEEYEEEPRSNTFLVIILTVVIMLLLAAGAFVGFRYFLPAFLENQKQEAPTTQTAATEPSESEETTVPTIPCTDLILNEAPRSLSKEGQFYLLNVKVLPGDTTDELKFVSGDESIVTVTGGGRIVAVGEGETTVYITCGNRQINCPVIVKYEEETEAPAEPTLAVLEETTDETAPETEAIEETEVTEEATEIVLKLKYTDRSISVGYGFTLELDCELEPSQVEWSVEHGHIAAVDEKGFVTAKAKGTTAVIVKYGDQVVQCIIRCK